jgi:hypothetical protein
VTYTLIAGVDLLEAVRRYGRVGRVGVVEDVAALPFKLHEQSERPRAGPITFLEAVQAVQLITDSVGRRAAVNVRMYLDSLTCDAKQLPVVGGSPYPGTRGANADPRDSTRRTSNPIARPDRDSTTR